MRITDNIPVQRLVKPSSKHDNVGGLQASDYTPAPDLGLSGPVPEGTVNGYGTATWIPTGYPLKTQPYLTSDNRLILRPIYNAGATIGSPQMDVYVAYILTALQYAVNKYALVPYNVNWNNGQANAQGIIEAYLFGISDIFMTMTRGYWDVDPNWLETPPQKDGLTSLQQIGKDITIGTVVSTLNGMVPGLGNQLTSALNSVSNGGITATAAQIAATNTTTAVTKSVENNSGVTTPTTTTMSSSSMYIIIAAIAVVIILAVWLS